MKKFLLLLLMLGSLASAQTTFTVSLSSGTTTLDSVSQNDHYLVGYLVYVPTWDTVDVIPMYWHHANVFVGYYRVYQPGAYQIHYDHWIGSNARINPTAVGNTQVLHTITQITIGNVAVSADFKVVDGYYVDIYQGDTTLVWPGGMDSPENFLGYYGFTNTYDAGSNNDLNGTSSFTDSSGSYNYMGDGIHHFEPHLVDYSPTNFNWGPQSFGILGAIHYLHKRGANALSWVSVNGQSGDGRDTWPTGDQPNGNGAFDPDRAKLDQWGKLIGYIDSLDMIIYWKLLEAENDHWSFDWFKAYAWEMIARYGHYQRIVWILSEESGTDTQNRMERLDYLRSICPNCELSIHTYPNQQGNVFPPILYQLDGLELQSGNNQIQNNLDDWLGSYHAVSWSEQGGANDGISNPGNFNTLQDNLGIGLMKGMAGMLGYRGYGYPHDDLDLESFRKVLFLQPMIVARKIAMETPDFRKMEFDPVGSTNDNWVRGYGQSFVSFCEDGDSLYLDLSPGTYNTVWINAWWGDTLSSVIHSPGSKLWNPYNFPVYAITTPIGDSFGIKGKPYTWRNTACVDLTGENSLEWWLLTHEGWELKYKQDYAIASNCYDYFGCGTGTYSVAKVKVTDLTTGEVTEELFEIKPEVKTLVMTEGVLIFPCGRSYWRLYDSIGRKLDSGFGDQFAVDRPDLPQGLYYLKLDTTCLTFRKE